MGNYAELLCKTNFSFLKGASHPEELVKQAAHLGLHALAINDDDGVYGIPKAYWESKNHPSLKLITGAQVTIESAPSLVLLAQNRQAYGLLCRLLTESHRYHEKGEAGVSLSLFTQMMQEPVSQGLIALIPPQPLHHLAPQQTISKASRSMTGPTPGIIDDPASFFHTFKEIFDTRIFLALPKCLDGLDAKRTHEALGLSKKLDIPLFATNDVYYHIPQRQRLQDVLHVTRQNTTLQAAGYALFSNAEKFIKPYSRMKLLYKDHPELLNRTLEIADRCSFSPSELRYTYPSEWIPQGYTAQDYLEKLTHEGAEKIYKGNIPPDVKRQIEHELKLIAQLRFADYFLTIFEIVDFARKQKHPLSSKGAARPTRWFVIAWGSRRWIR